MSAITIKGTIVSIETRRGTSKKTGKPYVMHTAYVVNGGGKPAELVSSDDPAPWKQGEKIDSQVTASSFNNNVTFRQIEAR
jgi:hypothetical protein